MATASITYDYKNFYWNDYRYGMTSRHSQNSGEYLSPPNGYINYYGYYHFNTTVPYLKSIRVHYTVYSNNYRIIGSYNHGLYVRVGSSWYLAGSVSMTYKTSDDSNYSYMGETDIDVTVNRSNVTDWCIVPTSLPNGSYEWWPTCDVGDGRLTITENLECNEFIDSNYISNIIEGNKLTERADNTTAENYINTFYNNMGPKVLTLEIDDNLVDATEVYVNIDGTPVKISHPAKVASGSCSWSSGGSYYDRPIAFSFVAEQSAYVTKITTSSSDNSYLNKRFIIDSTTGETIIITSDIISGLIVGRKYYYILEIYDRDYNDANFTANILLYYSSASKQTLEDMIKINGTETSLSFTKTDSMRQNFCGLIKLDVPTLPANMYFMMYNIKVSSSYQDGFMSIYDSDGNQLYRVDDNSSGWEKLLASHPTLGNKKTYNYDPLIMTTKSHSNGPFYIEFRKLGLSGTSMMNYTIEWGSL